MISKQQFQLKRDGTCKKRSYCAHPELIENYDLAISDKTQVWECHHRNEKFYSKQELKDLGLYYDRPPCELIFLTEKDHKRLHNCGKIFSDEHRNHLKRSHKGTSGMHWKWCKETKTRTYTI